MLSVISAPPIFKWLHYDTNYTGREDGVKLTLTVEYSSKGGGDISIRAKGVKKRIHTSKGINEISLDEIAIEGATQENLVGIFKDLLK